MMGKESSFHSTGINEQTVVTGLMVATDAGTAPEAKQTKEYYKTASL